MTKRRALKPSTDTFESTRFSPIVWDESQPDENCEDRWSTWGAAGVATGPQPWPDWLITDLGAHDEELGVLKSGKEADVHLIRRYSDDHECFLAAKRYRSSDHKLFHRDAAYLSGRRVRKSREMRAMQNRTGLGKKLLAAQWAYYEWQTLVVLTEAGLQVPYPVSYDGDEILMEFIADDDGSAAPRLAATHPKHDVLRHQFDQLMALLHALVRRGTTHGDLSPYNTLVKGHDLIFIDWPQLVDIVGNPEGFSFLHRDVSTMCQWFISKGYRVDSEEIFARLLAEL